MGNVKNYKEIDRAIEEMTEDEWKDIRKSKLEVFDFLKNHKVF